MENGGVGGGGDVPENGNDHFLGTQSESAGKSEACAGCPNQQICASAPKGPDPGTHGSRVYYSFSRTYVFLVKLTKIRSTCVLAQQDWS
ncbi:uncharacterized protein LOC133889204 isoform X3 [Phragmites australis]|uniref:uncharacterized protein LOC133889204 isoform X3 n=1 Tax=Phragmites australis TaxID=29695 RepID=UPI002D776F16|nr:uncharacterized protein LOC133889204 isoform X3 [Phragmites australis]